MLNLKSQYSIIIDGLLRMQLKLLFSAKLGILYLNTNNNSISLICVCLLNIT